MAEYVSFADVFKNIEKHSALFSAPPNSVAIVGDLSRAQLTSNVVMLESTTGYKKCAGMVVAREDFSTVGHLLMYRTFLAQAEGNVVVRYDEKDRDRKVYDLLIPTILENDRITTINNIPKSRAQEIYARDGNISAIVGYRSVKEEVTKNLPESDRRSKDYPLSNSEAVVMAIYQIGGKKLSRALEDYKVGAESLMLSSVKWDFQRGVEEARGFRNSFFVVRNYFDRRAIRKEQGEARKLMKEAEKSFDVVASELQSDSGLRRIKIAAIDILEGRRLDSRELETKVPLRAIKVEVDRVVRREKAEVVKVIDRRSDSKKMGQGIG